MIFLNTPSCLAQQPSSGLRRRGIFSPPGLLFEKILNWSGKVNSIVTAVAAGVLLVLLAPPLLQAQPLEWHSAGIGGGGALFSPGINPRDEKEYYLSSDMGGLFHTRDFGLSYDLLPFTQLQAGVWSRIVFTGNPLIRFALRSVRDQMTPAKSVDGGRTWSYLSSNPEPASNGYYIYADPCRDDRLLLGFAQRLYFSGDGGISFRPIHTALNSAAGIVVGGAFFAGDTIFVGTNDGVLFSADGGAGFSLLALAGIPETESIYSFSAARERGITRFFCVTGSKESVKYNVTGAWAKGFIRGVYALDWPTGAEWAPRMNGLDPAKDWVMFVGMAANCIDTLYLAGTSSSSNPNVIRTINGGDSWSRVFLTTLNENIYTGWSGHGGDQGWGYGEKIYGLAVAPGDVKRVIFTDMGFVHKSDDAGASWHQAYLAGADENQPGHVTPREKSYHSVGLENTSCWQVLWSDSLNLFAAFSDIRGLRSDDGGKSWSLHYTGHTQNTMYRIAHGRDGTLYGAASTVHDIYQSTRLTDGWLESSSATGQLLFSTDKGHLWQTLHDFRRPVYWVALDPNRPNRLYASVINYSQGEGGIWCSDDIQNGAASTWRQLPAPPCTEGHPAAIEVLDDGQVLCTFSGRRTNDGLFTPSSGLFLYSPATGSWNDLSAPGMRYWCQDVLVDPYDPEQNTWYVCVFSGWGGAPNGLGGLYRTLDRGATWARLANLDRVMSCTINPENHNQIYLTTEGDGLWLGDAVHSAEPQFTRIESYPFRQPTRIFFNPCNPGEMWVTSFGAGMRYTSLPQQPRLRIRLQLQGFSRPGGIMHTRLNPVLPLESPYFEQPQRVTHVHRGVVDWVMVELYRAPSDQSALWRRALFLRDDGWIAELDGWSTTLPLPGVPPGSYYLSVRHRNHVRVMSRVEVPSGRAQAALVDFGSGSTRCYDPLSRVELEPGLWGVAAGDANGDDMVTTRDYLLWYRARQRGGSEYDSADFNGDGVTDAADLALWRQMARMGAGSTSR